MFCLTEYIVNSKKIIMLTNENILQPGLLLPGENTGFMSVTEILQSGFLPGGEDDDDLNEDDDETPLDFDEDVEDTEDGEVPALNEMDLDEETIPLLDENDLEENNLTEEEAGDIDWENDEDVEDDEEAVDE